MNIETKLFDSGNEYTNETGGWIIADVSPHQYNNVSNGLVKNGSTIFNRVSTIWSASTLTTTNKLNLSNHKKICYVFVYYIPKQTNTGQGIYYGILSSYGSARIGEYLTTETTNQEVVELCQDISNINNGYPFIEIYNGHTTTPYTGYVANTYIALWNVYLR